MAWPRVRRVLSSREQRLTPYYDIGRTAKVLMGIAYILLSGLLMVMFVLCQWEAARRFGGGLMG
jgi:hypothetical protein